MPRFRALVEYDGTEYFGFQRQVPEQQTVQGELEKALSKLAQASIQVIGAGRTDAGVHATGQVIAFDTAWRHGGERLERAMNATLSRDIAVSNVRETDGRFHPRFDAKRRGYQYTILNRPNPSPLQRNRTWHVRHALDVDAMNAAAQHLIGRHDFGTFGTPPQGNNTVRDLFKAQWQREGELLQFDIEATAFLKRMVRSIVGSLKLVGEGSWSVDEFVDAMNSAERSRIRQTAPPQGLVLAFVSYEEYAVGRMTS